MDNESACSAWRSINDMLIQNRCWLCKHIFQKGKKKKVFLISQLIQKFREISQNKDDERTKLLTAFSNEIPYLSLCWQSYQTLKGNETKLNDLLYQAEVQVWISGLICARNELCAAIYNSLFSENSREEQIASILSLKGTFVKSAICPPGCDCGWQFISVSRPEVQVDNTQLNSVSNSQNIFKIATTTTTTTITIPTTTNIVASTSEIINESIESKKEEQNQQEQEQKHDEQKDQVEVENQEGLKQETLI